MLIIFCDARRKSTHELKIKIDGEKDYPIKICGMSGVLIDCHLVCT